MTKIQGSAENWENGKLGTSPEHAVRVPDEEAAAIDKAAGHGMQLISMRMPKDLIDTLKEIARYRGVGYQPMVRDLLKRWAVGEIKTILEERLKDAERRESECDKLEPLAPPIKKRA